MVVGRHRKTAAALLNEPPQGGLNIAGLHAVVAQIAMDPDAWNQAVYFGASPADHRRVAYCLAAWTCLLVGMDIESQAAADAYGIHAEAQRLLGLTRRQANQLFWWGADYAGDIAPAHPTVADLKTRITEVTGVRFDAPEPDPAAAQHDTQPVLAGAAC